MLRFTIDAPGVVTTNVFGLGYEIYGLAALGPGHILNTIQFVERRPDLGELGRTWTVPWDVSVPAGAQLFGATSAVRTGAPQQYWTGWLVGRTLHVQAIKQEGPFEAQLLEGEQPIFPPVMDKAGRLAVYSWRAAENQTALWRRTFTGNIHQPVTMTTEELARVPVRPLTSRAGVIADLETAHAILGWVESAGDGAVLGAALIEGSQVRTFRSEPIAGVAPFARQRLAVWAQSFACVEVDAVVESRQEPFGYTLARLSIGQNAPTKTGWWSTGTDVPPSPFNVPPEGQRTTLALKPSGVPPGKVHAVALEHFKNRFELNLVQAFLLKDGRLVTAWKVDDRLKEMRRNVALDDPLAVVTGASAAYWGIRHADGSITLESFY